MSWYTLALRSYGEEGGSRALSMLQTQSPVVMVAKLREAADELERRARDGEEGRDEGQPEATQGVRRSAAQGHEQGEGRAHQQRRTDALRAGAHGQEGGEDP